MNSKKVKLMMGVVCALLATTGCNTSTSESPVSAINGGFTTTTTHVGTGIYGMHRPLVFGQNQNWNSCTQVGSSCSTLIQPTSCQVSVPCTFCNQVSVQNICSQPFVSTVSNAVHPQGQITYNHAGTCGNQGEVLGSMQFSVPTIQDPVTLNRVLAGQVSFLWNKFVPRGDLDPIVDHYRIIAYGDEGMSPATTWVSPKIGGRLGNNSAILSLGSIGDDISFNQISIAQAQQLNLTNESFQRWNRLATYNSAGNPLGNVLNLAQQGAKYWYDVVAFNADGTPVLNRPGNNAPRDIMRRHLDIVQVGCSATIVAGFCSN